MQSKDHIPDTPSQPHASLLLEQRDANEHLILAALNAQEDAEDAHSGRIIAEDESDALRDQALELTATAEFRERLLGIIGHDLRNPLNAMVVAGQLLANSSALPEKDLRLARRIVESGQRMGRMIDQLANFTRARLGGGFQLDLVVCDLGQICRTVVEELRLSSGADIRLVTTGTLAGRWDADRLTELLSNVIGNATSHATEGSPISVHAREEAAGVIVDVRNQGVCIPPELLGTIFGAFALGQSQRQRERGHLGLGLYISHQIALSHGGKLEVESSGGSTTFSVRLPRFSELAALDNL